MFAKSALQKQFEVNYVSDCNNYLKFLFEVMSSLLHPLMLYCCTMLIF